MVEPLQGYKNPSESSGSRLIQSVLTPAIRFWLGTQVDHADDLAIEIQSRDRQILKGYIPSIQLAADRICYQGLSLGRLVVSATDIRVNWWGIARGQPLQLLAPIPVEALMCLSEADLNRSLQVEMFAQALTDLMAHDLLSIFNSNVETTDSSTLSNPSIDRIELRTDAIVMAIALTDGDRTTHHYVLSKLVLKDGHRLGFHQPQLLDHTNAVEGRSLPQLEEFSIDLGETVELTSLDITPGQLLCQGTIWVQP